MGYYMAGDYYQAGGIFGSIGKFLGGVAKTAVGAVGGVLTTGTPLGAVTGALKGAGIIKAPAAPVQLQLPAAGVPTMMAPQIPGGGPPAAAGGATKWRYTKKGTLTTRKRPRMNPTNPKALRRAQRREESFIRIARKSGLVMLPKAKRVRRAVSKRR